MFVNAIADPTLDFVGKSFKVSKIKRISPWLFQCDRLHDVVQRLRSCGRFPTLPEAKGHPTQRLLPRPDCRIGQRPQEREGVRDTKENQIEGIVILK